MSFIIKQNNPFINTKLTQKGRAKLAKGQLNFSFWAIGDSEINYDREEIFDTQIDQTYTAKILKSVDDQPNLKYFIHKPNTTDPLNVLNAGDIKTVKLIVNNLSDERGFFNNVDDIEFTTKTTSDYSIINGTVASSFFGGGSILDIGTTGVTIGDIVSFKITNTTFPTDPLSGTTSALPVLFYEVTAVSGTTLTFNRTLPDLSAYSSTINYFVFPGDDIYNTTLWGADIVSYWNSETLSFDGSCDISVSDIPVLNFTLISMEDAAGYFGFETYESFNYLGEMENYLSYNDSLTNPDTPTVDPCTDLLSAGFIDPFQKMLGIVHYTNNTISNFYGDFFHIDIANGKNLKLHIPYIMYHRRKYTGDVTDGTVLGMSFLGDGDLKLIEGTDIQYYDLIEDSTLIEGRTAKVVGKILPQLKLVLIDDDELLMAISQSTGRSWTLPSLKGRLINSVNGTNGGVLDTNKQMYLTYALSNPSGAGLPNPIHCGKYLIVQNKTISTKDVEFNIEDVDLLPYMRDTTAGGYDGLGFFGESFDLVYQITDLDTRPTDGAWKTYSFNTNILGSGTTISPTLLENQNSLFNDQIVTTQKNSSAVTYNYTTLVNQVVDTQAIGSEKFFYGNMRTSIGSAIYKTIFDLRINSGEFTETSNPTRSTDVLTNPPTIRVSEIGIYDSDGDLVMIGKLSQPIKLESGTTVMIELSMDF